MQYKALMLDVDGTLVTQIRTGMTPKVLSALKKAKKLVHIGFATGRPPFLMEPLFRQFSFNGPSIFCGGALVLDLPSHKEIYKQYLIKKDIPKVATILKKLHIPLHINLGKEDALYDSSLLLPDDIRDMFTVSLTLEHANTAIDALSHIPTIAVYLTTAPPLKDYALQITHASATKQHGIVEVAKHLGISTHEMIGVGDGYNDFPLLMACGLKVAMGNAPQELKEIADYIAPSVHDDGVAEVIRKFILT